MDRLYKAYIGVLLLALILLMILVWSPETFSQWDDATSAAVPAGTIYGKQTGYWVGVAVGVVGSLLVVPPLQHQINTYFPKSQVKLV